MNRIAFLPTVAALCLMPVSWAISQEPVVHQVAFPKGDAAWTVTYENEDSASPNLQAAALPSGNSLKKAVKIDIVRQGNIRRDITTLSDGSTVEKWWIVNPPVVLFDNGGRVSSMMGSAMAQLRFDASSFEWISAKTYLGKKAYQGEDSQYYEMKVIDPGAPTKTLRAWIDTTTYLPVAYDNGFGTVSFSFPENAPIPPLQMPDNFKQKYDQLKAFYAPPQTNR